MRLFEGLFAVLWSGDLFGHNNPLIIQRTRITANNAAATYDDFMTNVTVSYRQYNWLINCWVSTCRSVNFRVLLALFGSLMMSACQTPGERLLNRASQLGFSHQFVAGDGFDHLVIENRQLQHLHRNHQKAVIDTLHIYLEGDGSPWRLRVFVMNDPTPRQPLMMQLMAYDQTPALYLGRPCYNGRSQDEGCDSDLWTFGRYSVTVVNSMAKVIREITEQRQIRTIRLFGHSGGGALAMLLAPQIEEVSAVVTLAGNLDTDAWTTHHRFTPLFGSLNPANAPLLGSHVLQWHLIGERDGNIPADIVREAIQRQSRASNNTEAWAFANFNHGCCWTQIWPQVLARIADPRKSLPGRRF